MYMHDILVQVLNVILTNPGRQNKVITSFLFNVVAYHNLTPSL